MTDTAPTSETQGQTVEGPALTETPQAAMLRQMEEEDAKDRDREALEAVEQAGELNAEAEQLAGELNDDHTNEAPPDPTSALIEGFTKSTSFAEEGRFFARMTTQLVEIRHATRIAQVILRHQPDYLVTADAEEIKALFARARVGAAAVFSLLNAAFQTIERAQGVASAGAPEVAEATDVDAPETPISDDSPASVTQEDVRAAKAGGPPDLPVVWDHARSVRPPSNAEPVPSASAPGNETPRQKVVRIQLEQERARKAAAAERAKGKLAPKAGRIAPPLPHREKPHGPVTGRREQPARDPIASLRVAAQGLLNDLRRQSHPVQRERITRFCEAIGRLADEGKLTVRLGNFAKSVLEHPNPKNVVKLAAFYLDQVKSL